MGFQTTSGPPRDHPGTTPGPPRRNSEKHTFKNSSDAFQTAPKDLYTLNSLPVVYLNPRSAASSLSAACKNMERELVMDLFRRVKNRRRISGDFGELVAQRRPWEYTAETQQDT